MIRTLLAFAFVALLAVPAQAAIKIQKVVSPGGIEAWLVEDHRVPLMAMDIAFTGGAALDPQGKEGLAIMTASLMDEGAGNLDSNAFQKELADKSIRLGFGADQDAFEGSLKALTKYRDRAFEMLALSLTKARFDPEPVERIRNQMVTSLSASLGNPGYVGRRKLMETIFAGHPYARSANGTIPSVRAITIDDMRGFLKARLGRDQLLVTVAGDISAAELGQALDKVFSALPAKSAPFTVAEIVPKAAGQTITVERGIPQTMITMTGAGLKRDDPDWWPGQVVNYILGGGGFNSRLMEAVRGADSKKGLSYGVSSAFVPYRHAGLVQAGGSTKNATAGETLQVIRDVFAGIYKDGVTDAELKDAKNYLNGSLALTATSTDRIAGLLMQLRQDNLGIDYLEKRDALIDGVTQADVKRVAQRVLDPAKMTTVMVGKPEGLNAK